VLEKKPADRFQSARELADALSSGASVPPSADRQARRQQRLLLGSVAAVVLVVVLAVGQWGLPGRGLEGPAGTTFPRASIAVLPFENLAIEPSRAYFASGLHDELLTQLAKASALKVISRTSVQEYAETTKPLAVIAEELGVGSIVEASVQVEGDRLRVNVQLIDTATDEHLWAESYERTIDDVFATQSEIAGHIVSAVGASLTEEEAGAFGAAPTDNPEAYRMYLQGQAYTARPGYHREDFESARALYEQALALDSSFALAHAALSRAHGAIWQFYDPSPERFARAREEAEIALRLAPNLLAAQMAMIAIHWHRKEWQPALGELRGALPSRPNDPLVISSIGGTHRRLGNWNEAVAAIERAMALDPRSAGLYWDLGAMTLRYLHRYEDALNALNHALILDPDFVEAQLMRAEIYFEWHGEMDSLRALIDRGPASFGLGGSRIWWQIRLALLEREPNAMLTLLSARESLPLEAHGMERLAADAVGLLYEAWAHQLRGDESGARRVFTEALARLDSVSQERPRDWQVHASRGLALAGLGRGSEARREVEWLDMVENWPDVYARGEPRAQRAMILAQAGWVDEALDAIEHQLAGPGWISAPVLRIDPRWDPIRDDPRFQALLATYEH
jgi:serine/threonine-protein kinase